MSFSQPFLRNVADIHAIDQNAALMNIIEGRAASANEPCRGLIKRAPIMILDDSVSAVD